MEGFVPYDTPIERRSLIKGLAGLPLAAILADPVLAQAQAEQTKLTRIKTKGGRDAGAAIAMPAKLPAPTLLLIHEWWGLNDQIKAVAVEFANQGYMAVAVDLMNGQVANDATQAGTLSQAVKADEATDTMASWVDWARNHQNSTRKLATVGWCFGGGWSLNASVATPVDATVIYYGRCNLPTEQLAKLQGPVLGHFGSRDKFINKPMVDTFEANMKAAGKPYTVHWYDADHAFANPTGGNYDREDAQLAWTRTMDFLKQNIG
jgi:carboxymethylenebutenolidase